MNFKNPNEVENALARVSAAKSHAVNEIARLAVFQRVGGKK